MNTHWSVIAGGYRAFPAGKRVRWTKPMREAFLDHLSATCNVKESAAVIGVDPVSVYWLRRHEPAFADAWATALALGYEMLETLLVGQALAGDTGHVLTTGADPKSGAIAVDLALKLLVEHRNASGKPKRGGPKRQFAEAEQTDMALMTKLAQIEARRQPALPAPVPPTRDEEQEH